KMQLLLPITPLSN
uniref:Uncharacterized protein n=1 Tax=Solanum lycopersicum TaxID=4081 RepID=A0A3Q7H672_SOLLC